MESILGDTALINNEVIIHSEISEMTYRLLFFPDEVWLMQHTVAEQQFTLVYKK